MYFHMLFHVSLLVKLSIASSKIASEGFFICVNSQMVEKIVPESKDFVTVLVSTVEKSDYCSIGFKAPKFKDIVQGCLWCILWVDCSKIKVLSFQHHNRVILIKNVDGWIAFFTIGKIFNEIKPVFFLYFHWRKSLCFFMKKNASI